MRLNADQDYTSVRRYLAALTVDKANIFLWFIKTQARVLSDGLLASEAIIIGAAISIYTLF